MASRLLQEAVAWLRRVSMIFNGVLIHLRVKMEPADPKEWACGLAFGRGAVRPRWVWLWSRFGMFPLGGRDGGLVLVVVMVVVQGSMGTGF